MAAVITTYTGLQSAVSAWLARDGDVFITQSFDDLMALFEQRMYYGSTGIPEFGIPDSPALRLRQMETTNAAFSLSSATVAQPTGFLEMIEANLNTPARALKLVAEGVISAFATAGQTGAPFEMAISGTNLRMWPDPTGGSYTATIRYFAKLTTPTSSVANWILENIPGLYLNGILLEAAIMTGDWDSAKGYGALYAGFCRGAHEQRNRELGYATNVRTRLRSRTP